VNAQPNTKQIGDLGSDGVARFLTDTKGGIGRVLVSVKGGKKVGPDFVRDLLGTVHTQKAEMGLLIMMSKPTRGITDAANHAGTYAWPVNNVSHLMPYIPAKQLKPPKSPDETLDIPVL
jgi:Restriction endonuclease